MPDTITSLAFEIDSGPAVAGAAALDKLTASARQTAQAQLEQANAALKAAQGAAAVAQAASAQTAAATAAARAAVLQAQAQSQVGQSATEAARAALQAAQATSAQSTAATTAARAALLLAQNQGESGRAAAEAAQAMLRAAQADQAVSTAATAAARAAVLQAQAQAQSGAAAATAAQQALKLAQADQSATTAATASARAAVANAQAQKEAAQASLEAATHTSRFGQALSGNRQQIQNASFQIADFATQVAGGGSAVTALAQQLPQLLGGFGVVGAAIGAASAIAGALINHFINLGDESTAVANLLKGDVSTGFDHAASLAEKYAGQLVNASAETRRFLQETARLQLQALDTDISKGAGGLTSGIGQDALGIGDVETPGAVGTVGRTAGAANSRSDATARLIAAVKSGDPDQVSAVARELGLGGTAEQNATIQELRSKAAQYAATKALEAADAPALKGQAGTGPSGAPSGSSGGSKGTVPYEVDSLLDQFKKESEAAKKVAEDVKRAKDQIEDYKRKIGAVGNTAAEGGAAALNAAPENATAEQRAELERLGKAYALAQEKQREFEKSTSHAAAGQKQAADQIEDLKRKIAAAGDPAAEAAAAVLNAIPEGATAAQRAELQKLADQYGKVKEAAEDAARETARIKSVFKELDDASRVKGTALGYTPEGRPRLPNEDGSFSTELTATVTDPRIYGGRATNIPTIVAGKRLDEDHATDFAASEVGKGRQYPNFGSIDEAVTAAEARTKALGEEGESIDKLLDRQQFIEQYLRGIADPSAREEIGRRAAEIFKEKDARDQLVAGLKLDEALAREADQQQRLSDVQGQGITARKQVQATIEAENRVRGMLGEITSDNAKRLIEEITAMNLRNDAAKDAAETNDEYAGAAKRLADRLAELNEQEKTGKLDPEAKKRAAKAALKDFNQDRIDELSDSNKPFDGIEIGLRELLVEVDSTAIGISKSLTGAFDTASDALGEFITTGKADFKGMIASFLADLAKYYARQALLRTAVAVGGAIGGYGGGAVGTAHSGAAIGRDALGSHAPVDPMLFASAPRYHTGGSVHAVIAQTGEVVMDREQAAAYDRGDRARGIKLVQGIGPGVPGMAADEVPMMAQAGTRVLSRREVAEYEAAQGTRYGAMPRHHSGGDVGDYSRTMATRSPSRQMTSGADGDTLSIQIPISMGGSDKAELMRELHSQLAQTIPATVDAAVAKTQSERRRNPNARI